MRASTSYTPGRFLRSDCPSFRTGTFSHRRNQTTRLFAAPISHTCICGHFVLLSLLFLLHKHSPRSTMASTQLESYTDGVESEPAIIFIHGWPDDHTIFDKQVGATWAQSDQGWFVTNVNLTTRLVVPRECCCIIKSTHSWKVRAQEGRGGIPWVPGRVFRHFIRGVLTQLDSATNGGSCILPMPERLYTRIWVSWYLSDSSLCVRIARACLH